jgi:hypothetical protein
MSDKEEYIRRLDKIERDLEWIIQYLMIKGSSIPTQTSSNVCRKCGMDFTHNQSYMCGALDCPKMLRAT